MTHTDKLRRALRAYDLAGPETPERAAALAAVLSAAHGVCDTAPSWADLIDSAPLLALVFFIMYTLDSTRPL